MACIVVYFDLWEIMRSLKPLRNLLAGPVRNCSVAETSQAIADLIIDHRFTLIPKQGRLIAHRPNRVPATRLYLYTQANRD